MPSVLDRAKVALRTPRHKQKIAAKQQLAAQSAPAPKVSLDQRIKWETKTITVEKCHDLITKCSVEIKARGLDIPLLCKPFHMDADYKRIVSLVRNYFDKPIDFVGDIKFAIVQDIIGVVKWALAHVRRDGQRGLLEWSVYDHFVAKEREQNFVKNAYQNDLARVISPHLAALLDTLFDLLSSICAYSKINGYTSTRLIKQFAIWILPTEHNILLDFANGYRDWLKSADAAEHIFLAYLRASTSPLPVRLAELLNKYPERPPPPPRKIAVLRLLRSVNELSHNLLSDSLDWRVYPGPTASDWLALKSSGVVDSMANNLLLRNAMAQRKSGKPPTDRIQLNYHHPLHRSLIDKEWSDFADLGFKADSAAAVNSAETPFPHRAGDRILPSGQSIVPLRARKRQQAQPLRKALTFDLDETERLQRRQKRSTIDWDSFQNQGFKGRETIEARELDLSIKEEEEEEWEDEQDEDEDEDFIVIDPQMKKHLQYLRKMGVQHGEPANVIGKVDIDEVFVDSWLECIIEAGGRIGTWIVVEFKDGWSMLEEQISQQALANAAAAALAAQAKAKKHPLLKSLAKVGKSKTSLSPQTGGVRLHSTTTTTFSPSKTTLPYSSYSTGNAPSTTTFSTVSKSPMSTPSTQAPSLYSTRSHTSLRPATSDSATTVKANNRMGSAFSSAVSLVKTTSRNMHTKSTSTSSAGSKNTIKPSSMPVASSSDLPDLPTMSARKAPEEKMEVLRNANNTTQKPLPIPKRSASIKAPSSPQLPSQSQFAPSRNGPARMDTRSPPSSPRRYQSPVEKPAVAQQMSKPQISAAPRTPATPGTPAVSSPSIKTSSAGPAAAVAAAGVSVVGAAALESNKSSSTVTPNTSTKAAENAPQQAIVASPQPSQGIVSPAQVNQPVSKSKPKKAKGRGLTDFMDSLRGSKKQLSSPKGISSSNFQFEAKDAGSGKLNPAVPRIATSLEIQNARRAEEMAEDAERDNSVGPLASEGISRANPPASLQLGPNLGVPPPPLHSPAKSLVGSNASSEDLKPALDAPPLPTLNQIPTFADGRAPIPERRSPSPVRSLVSRARQASSPRTSPRPSPQSSPRNVSAALPPPQSPFSERPVPVRQPSNEMWPEMSRQTSMNSFSSSSLNTPNTPIMQQRSASPLPSPVSPPIGSTLAEFPIPPTVSPAPAEYRRNSPSPNRRISAGIPANARSFIPPSVSLELSLVQPNRPDPPRSSSPHNYSQQAATYSNSPKRSSIPRPVEAPRAPSPQQFPRSATPTGQGAPASAAPSNTTRLPRLSTSSRTNSISGRESPALLSPSSASSTNEHDEGSSKFKRASMALKQRLQGTVVGANAEGATSGTVSSERARSPTPTSLPKRAAGSGIPVVASVSARVKQINSSAITSQLPIRSNSSLSNRDSDEIEKVEKDRLKKEWKEREKEKRRSIARYGVGEDRLQDPRSSVASSLDIEDAYGGIEAPVQERARQVSSVDTRGVEDYVNRMLK